MSEYCNRCTEELFPPNHQPEIDVYARFKEIDEGFFLIGVLCEGCSLCAISNEGGELRVSFMGGDKEKLVEYSEENWKEQYEQFQ